MTHYYIARRICPPGASKHKQIVQGEIVFIIWDGNNLKCITSAGIFVLIKHYSKSALVDSSIGFWKILFEGEI